jgi:hypothetical protein
MSKSFENASGNSKLQAYSYRGQHPGAEKREMITRNSGIAGSSSASMSGALTSAGTKSTRNNLHQSNFVMNSERLARDASTHSNKGGATLNTLASHASSNQELMAKSARN